MNTKIKKIAIIVLTIMSIVGCSPLLAPTVIRHQSLNGYKYVYLSPTAEKTAVSGGAFGSGYGLYSYTTTHSVNPTDLISGHFLKRGYTRLTELKPELIDETIIVNYGESGRRDTGWGSYTIEVTIQILSAKTNEVICVGTAEGRGETEADDVRIAINRCMAIIFEDGN